MSNTRFLAILMAVIGFAIQGIVKAQTIDLSACGPLCAPARLVSDPASYQSIFIGSYAGAGADLVTPLKTMYTCIGFRTCGGEGAGFAPGAVNAEITAIGWTALSHLTTGTYNTVVGVGSMRNETTGIGNVALGVDVMAYGNGNTSSVAVGNNAFGSGVHAYSIAVGSGAGGFNTTSSITNSIVVGAAALAGGNVTTVDATISIGNNNLGAPSVTSPSNNTLVGRSILAGAAVTNPTNNVILGTYALNGSAVTNPIQNIVIGVGGFNNSTATAPSYNTAIGYNVCATCTGNGNVMLGYNTGTHISSASNNTIIGSNVATTILTTGGNNILIGTNSSVDTVAANTANEVNIGKVFIGFAATPVVSAGYGTNPTVTGSGSAAFKIVVGAGGGSTSSIVYLAPAPTGWVCVAQDETTAITSRQSADTATSVTTTWSAAPAANDNIVYQCGAY